MGGIALMWRGGCIIRSQFLGKIKDGVRQEQEARQPAAGQVLLAAGEQVPGDRGARR
jgi:6-phosphogluconate dehydrogenase